MDYSFPRYLLSKQSVDDRALNRTVLEALKSAISTCPALSIVEVGAGIGTMLARLLRWGVLPSKVDYTLVEMVPENIAFAREWLAQWACEQGYQVEATSEGLLLSIPGRQTVSIKFANYDVFDFVRLQPEPADLLIAHAFLDLLPMPEGLSELLTLVKPDGLAWLTLNFDGVTTLEPALDPELDAKIERLYHATMDQRSTGGDSLSGRHLFGYLKQAGGEIVSAGASDWVVYPVQGQYSDDEAYFLHFILHFFETSLAGHPQLDPASFADWLMRRRDQIECGALVYIAHQMDFLVTPPQGIG